MTHTVHTLVVFLNYRLVANFNNLVCFLVPALSSRCGAWVTVIQNYWHTYVVMPLCHTTSELASTLFLMSFSAGNGYPLVLSCQILAQERNLFSFQCQAQRKRRKPIVEYFEILVFWQAFNQLQYRPSINCSATWDPVHFSFPVEPEYRKKSYIIPDATERTNFLKLTF